MFTITCLTIGAFLPPVSDLQGNWHMCEMRVREAGATDWTTHTYRWPSGPFWRVRGVSVESTYRDKETQNRLSIRLGTSDGVKGVQFVDYNGVVYTGSYAIDKGKDGTVVLNLIGFNVPVPGEKNLAGTKYLIIHLERHKKQAENFAPIENTCRKQPFSV